MGKEVIIEDCNDNTNKKNNLNTNKKKVNKDLLNKMTNNDELVIKALKNWLNEDRSL